MSQLSLTSAPSLNWKNQPLLALALFLLCIVAFAPSIGHGVMWDDAEYVTENTFVHRWSGPGWFWLEPGSNSIQWYPMTFTATWAQHKIFGLWLPGFHTVNILLHALNAILVWRILKRLDFTHAWAAAALFAVHPTCTETTGWMSEQKNLLMMLFALLSLRLSLQFYGIAPATPAPTAAPASVGVLDYASSARRPVAPWKLYALSLLTLFLSLTSKPALCGLPLIVLAILWMKHKLTLRAALLQLPHFLMAFAVGLFISYVEKTNAYFRDPALEFTLLQRTLIAGYDLAFYVGKFLWPHPLLGVYPRWDPAQPPAYVYILPFLIVGVLAALFFTRKYIGRAPLAGALIALLAIGPMLGFISFASMVWAFVADHYSYAVTPVFAALLVFPLARLIPRDAFNPLFAAILITCAVISFQTSFLYRNATALWSHTLEYVPDDWQANHNMANALIAQKKESAALPYAQRAVRANPSDIGSRFELAIALRAVGRYDEALEQLDFILTRHPRHINAGLIADKLRKRDTSKPAKYSKS